MDTVADAPATSGQLIRVAGIGIAAGLITGVLTIAGQGALDSNLNRLANSGAIWVTVAFAVGSRARTDPHAAIAGLLTLVAALLGYEVAARVGAIGISTGALLVWLGTAVVGGPMFGVAGHWWRSGSASRHRLAIALLGAVFVAEGLWTVLRILALTTTGAVEAAVGVALVPLLGRSHADRIGGLVRLPILSVLGLLAYAAIERILASG